MPGIPDEPVLGEVERQVEGQAELDHAEVAREVGGASADDADQLLAHLRRQPLEILSESEWRSAGDSILGNIVLLISSPFPKDPGPTPATDHRVFPRGQGRHGLFGQLPGTLATSLDS